MTGYGDSRWHKECFGRCGACISCLHPRNNNEEAQDALSKRFVTVGSVRYGVRLGAVSPPPPGAGPRYRSQCCWPSVPGPGPVSRIPLLSTPTINNHDIFRCVNRVRMSEDPTSEHPEQTVVRNQVLYSTKSLLKTQLRRRTLTRPQVYARLCEYGDNEATDIINTLDRLPRFRFGGNRNSSSKEREREREREKERERERDKRGSDQRLRELTDRLKRGPVPPPRTRHVQIHGQHQDQPQQPEERQHHSPQHSQQQQQQQQVLLLQPRIPHSPPPTLPENISEDSSSRTVPLRSASFSQVDYSLDDKKYVKRRHPLLHPNEFNDRTALTLPRLKHATVRPSSLNSEKQPPLVTPDETSTENVKALCEIIYQGCKDDYSNKGETTTTTPDKQIDSVPKNAQEKKRDKSRRRKGMYISQWPNTDGEIVFSQEEEPIQSVSPEIPKLHISYDKSSSRTNLQEGQQSPEESSEWLMCKLLQSGRPLLSAQSSEEKDTISIKSKGRGSSLLRADSLSEGETDQGERRDQALVPSDISDCESRTSVGNDSLSPHIPRRYSKRPLRGPYGQMLEAEMKKPEAGRKQYSNELKFLEDISTSNPMFLLSSSSVGAGDPKPKYVTRIRGSSNHSMDDSQLKNSFNSLMVNPKPSTATTAMSKRKVSVDSGSLNSAHDSDQKLTVSHQRTTSSPSKLEGLAPPDVSNELLEQLLKGSSEQLAASENIQRNNDTRTHVVVELYDTERSYVESLQILITKYLEPLKSPENAALLDTTLVDEIFFQIPSLLSHHQVFLDELKRRLEHWDVKQKVGDIFLETFSKPAVIESYTNYVNNWKRARDIIKSAQQSKPAFARFLESTAREHKGKLALDSLLIKPIQKFPKYELLIQRLIKHTDVAHPDHSLLLAAQREVHEQLLKINCTEREALELEQLREIEGLIEGLMELVATDRQYLRHDLVSMAAGGGTRKERALFLFSDLLLVTSIKRKSGTIRKPSSGQGSVTSTLDANKYKLLMRISLDDLEIAKAKDENLRQIMVEIEKMTEDISVLNQVSELSWSLHCSHPALDEVLKEMIEKLNKQLSEQQNSDSQLSCLELSLNTSNGLENISIVFSKPDKRASWEESFNEAKHKLAMSGDRKPSPELVATVPIRKTRAGLQFTCAAPAIGDTQRDVWVCNSDGYVGQVCVLSLQPEPNVTSCNGVCNARILCIASVPGISTSDKHNLGFENKEEHNSIQFDSSSSSDDEERSDVEETVEPKRNSSALKSAETASIDSDESDNQQSTMWLGTEDGCIHIYNSNDNIRIKKNKIKLQHGSSVLCIIYLDNRVYVSLANGDLVIYEREHSGGWNSTSPTTITIGSTTTPISKMLPNNSKLWCSCGNTIKVINTETLTTENTVTVNNDSNKPIYCMILSGNGLWLSMQNSAIIKCFHALSFELLCEVNVAQAVTKMLTSCDDIIRQHKAACLRVTSLLACKDLLWIGTSAGVLLTMSLPHITPTTTKLNAIPCVVGVPHGHTGHVRFLTSIEYPMNETVHHRYSYKGKPEQRNSTKLLIISGGDGYEDFRSSNLSEVAGREDSTNHLLLWNI